MPTEPINTNLLSGLGFKFNVRRLPNVQWFVQQVSIPGITLGEAIQPTPWMDAYQPDDKLEFDQLTIMFKVDEDLRVWTELFDWMVGLGSPTSFGEYASNIRRNGTEAIVTDATLTIMNSNMNPRFEIFFHDLFPVTMTELQFDSTDTNVNYLTLSATFRYLNYEFRRIDT